MFGGIWNRLKSIGERRGVILMYHQVTEKKCDPWDLAVHPERFASQIYFLKRHYDVVPVEELADAAARNKLRNRLIAITFDDGFADNFTNAAPMLEWVQLPATFYISTQAVEEKHDFWWEELQNIVLQSEHLPKHLELQVNGADIRFSFTRDHVLHSKLTQEIKCWRANMPAPNERAVLYYNLWQKMQPLSHNMQAKTLRDIRSWAQKTSLPSTLGRVMTQKQVETLSKNSLFSIGAHTVTHSMLAAQERERQTLEISQSKNVLESWIGKKVKGFAYPYGSYSGETKRIISENGFAYAVSTEAASVTKKSDRFALPRLQVKNWTPQELAQNIKQLFGQ